MDTVATRWTTRVVLLTAVAALSGCQEGEARDLHLGGLTPLVAEEEMRIGDVDDPDLGFSRVAGLDVDRDGDIYVLEATDRQIRVYTPAGQLRRRIGGPGDGPGEFRSAPRFGVVGDTVWSWDSSALRITIFDRNGELLSTGRTDGLEVPLWSCFGSVLPSAMRTDGLFTGALTRVSCSRERPTTGVQPTDSVPVPRVLFDASGAVVDTIGWDESPPPRLARPPSMELEAIRRTQVAGRTHYVPVPPPTTPQWEHVHDGRIILEERYAETAAEGVFRITRLGLSRDTIFHRTYHYTPIPYSEADLDSIAQRAARGGPGGGVPYARGPDAPGPPDNVDVIARALRAKMEYPPFRLPIQGFQVGADESLWLRRDIGESPTARWILLDDQALPRGQLELPADVRILWTDGDVFWATVPGEYEVPWVVRYRIRPG